MTTKNDQADSNKGSAGAAPQGAAPQGAAPQGAAPQGAAPQGAAPVAPVVSEPARKYKAGDKVLVSGVIADQVNPLTNNRIPHGTPTLQVYDRWIEIQLDAKVLADHAL